jgi:outer membrane receptor protein involved in Fe transport
VVLADREEFVLVSLPPDSRHIRVSRLGEVGVNYFRGVFQFLAACAIVFLCSSVAFGQTTASLRGTITDQSGAVLVGAKITLTNTGTGVPRTTQSGADGLYLFDQVQVGKYKVTVEKDGFTTFEQTGIILELNQFGRLDVSLKLGQTSQVVEVTGNVAQVDTTGAVLGKVENQRMIVDLPLVDRDTLQLGLLQAGVFSPDQDDSSGNPFSVSGQRSESLTFLLDGGNNTDFLGNNIVVSPNPDAVEEFKILTNNYDAQYGRTSGGIVNQITRSGTNEFHGTGFEFLRNTDLNARDYFLPPTEPKNPFKRNAFGGTFGGPIKKDKTFFFLSYQGVRTREGDTSAELTVLSPAERTGNFGELCDGSFNGAGACSDPAAQLINPYTNGSIPFNDLSLPNQGGPGTNGSLVNPVIQNYINKYLPLPNLPDNGYIASPSQSIDADQGIVHIDHNFGPHDTLSFVYLIEDDREFFPLPGSYSVPLGGGNSTDFRDQIGTLTWNHTFSPTLTNEFRFGANRTSTHQAVPSDTTAPSALGFTNVVPDDPAGVSPPIMFTANFNLGSSPQGPTSLNDNTFQWADNLTWTHGKHEFKFGTDITRLQLNFHYDYYNNGGFDFDGGYADSFTGDANADFVGGFWDNYYQNSQSTYGIRTGSVGLYAQDIWKVLPRLTLNYGLRWDYYIPQYDVHNEILGFFPGQQSTVFPDAPESILYPHDPGTPNRALVYPDYTNFAPRFGFAWDMLGNSKIVMRGGFGMFYDIEDGALNLQFGGLPPYAAVANTYPSYPGTTGDPVADPFTPFGLVNNFPFLPSDVGTFGTPKISYGYTTFPHFRTPYSENFNFGFQWQATKDTMVEAVYVGSLGRRLISTAETNFPVPSVLAEQYNDYGMNINPDCARPLAACVGGSTPIDPVGSPTGATQLYTNLSDGISDSDELQVTVDKRFSQQFALRGAYTWAKTIDLTSGFRSRSSTYTDPLDHRLDRALADFDVPQRLVISGIWELPFDRHFQNAILEKAAQGWQFNGIATFQGGQPFTLYSDNNSSFQNSGLDRPDLIAPIKYLNPRSTGYWFDPSSFNSTGPLNPDGTINPAGVPLFTFGTTPRNALRGPGVNNFDLSLIKNTTISEQKTLQFRAEFFNAFNHGQFYNPDNYGDSDQFGQISTARPMRIIQFGLKLLF